LAHVADLEKAFSMIAKLGLKVGTTARDREDYDAALTTLEETMKTLLDHQVKESSPAYSKVRVVVEEIRQTTGPLSVEWLGDAAAAAAKAAGKKLPTLAQWTHAAFGAPNAKSPRYPWGDRDGEPGVQFVGGVDDAQDVESCPAGASKFGCLNMAGNVWEWIDT